MCLDPDESSTGMQCDIAGSLLVSVPGKPQQFDSIEEPQQVNLAEEPQHVDLAEKPQHLDMAEEPQYAVLAEEPQQFDLNKEPHHITSAEKLKPQHADSGLSVPNTQENTGHFLDTTVTELNKRKPNSPAKNR